MTLRKKQLRGRPRIHRVVPTVYGDKVLTKRRVHQHCLSCGSEFSYLYPGTGPYRSFCPTCKPSDSWPYGTH